MSKPLSRPVIGLLFIVLCASFVWLNASASRRQIVPPPAAARADRFGVSNWNVDYAAYPASQPNAPDRLNWGAEAVASLGTRVIGAYLGFYDIYHVIPPNTPELAALAAAPAYDKLFRDARFNTYMLWVYSRGAAASNWDDGFSAAEYAAERDEMRRLGEYLLSNAAFAGKRFILFNWEAENAIGAHANKEAAWQAMRDWHRARVEGVALARQRFPNSQAKLFSGLEYAFVRNGRTGQACGAPVSDPVNTDPLANRCAMDFIGAELAFDYYGYSAWQTINEKFDNPALDLKAALKRDLQLSLNVVKAKRPDITEHNFMLLEYSFERVRYGECAAADVSDELIAALEGPDAFPVSYALWWQAIDNAPHFGYGVTDEYFGFYRTRNGQLNLSLAGQVFQKRLANQTVTRATDCPLIRRPPAPFGVLDLTTGSLTFRLDPASVLDVYTEGCCTNPPHPFSTAGNVVHLDQRVKKFALARAQVPTFTESATRINAPLPADASPDDARVWLTDAQGRDSNWQNISLRCDTCPRIQGDCPVLETEYQTYRIAPGDTVTIKGARFAPSGNVVMIEQQSLTQSVARLTLPRANFVSESSAELKIVLPTTLAATYATLSVIDPQGRASNHMPLALEPPCNDCVPRLTPCGGAVVSRATTGAAGKFYAGELFELRGRFQLTNNRIVVEQYDQQARRSRSTLGTGASGWREDTKTLTARLPLTLFPGRALLYVEDRLTRISRAYSVTITARPVTSVSAANYSGPAVAQESIIAAFGIALAPSVEVAASNPLPTELSGVRVVVRDSANVERPAPLFFVSPAQINYQVPLGTALGLATVTFFNGFGSSAPGTLEITATAPGLFAANANGRGAAAAIALRVKADGSQTTEPIVELDATTTKWILKPLDLGPANEQVFLILFGTGWRGRATPAAAMIGGANAEAVFAGAQSDFVGLDQANLRLSRSLIGRGAVAVTLAVDGKTSNAVEINVR